MKAATKILLPLLLLFVIISIALLIFHSYLSSANVDTKVLHFANILFLFLAVVVFFMQQKALANSNPNVFIRSVIGGTMLKMFSTVIAVLAYVVLTGKDYNTKAVFISMFLYLLYLAVEVVAISKTNKSTNG